MIRAITIRALTSSVSRCAACLQPAQRVSHPRSGPAGPVQCRSHRLGTHSYREPRHMPRARKWRSQGCSSQSCRGRPIGWCATKSDNKSDHRPEEREEWRSWLRNDTLAVLLSHLRWRILAKAVGGGQHNAAGNKGAAAHVFGGGPWRQGRPLVAKACGIRVPVVRQKV